MHARVQGNLVCDQLTGVQGNLQKVKHANTDKSYCEFHCSGTFVICRLESTFGRVGDGAKGVAMTDGVNFSEVAGSNTFAFMISKPDFFGEETAGFALGSILGFLEEALFTKAFLFSREDEGGAGGPVDNVCLLVLEEEAVIESTSILEEEGFVGL